MTWEIVAGLITLLGAVVSIGKIIANNTKAMTEVRCSNEALNETVKGLNVTVKNIDEKVENHEIRITVLEHDKE